MNDENGPPGMLAMSTPTATGRMRAFGSPMPSHGASTLGKSALSELRSPLGERTNSPFPTTAHTPSKSSMLSPTSAGLLQK